MLARPRDYETMRLLTTGSHGRGSVLECGGPPPLWNVRSLSNETIQGTRWESARGLGALQDARALTQAHGNFRFSPSAFRFGLTGRDASQFTNSQFIESLIDWLRMVAGVFNIRSQHVRIVSWFLVHRCFCSCFCRSC
jgi:hypothetical protein